MPQQASPTVAEAKKGGESPITIPYTDAEKQYREQMLSRLEQMRDEREQRRPQFDDMTFSQWDDRQIKADISYIPPAKNKGDTRIVTGTTRDKDSTLVSTALSYDFERNITAYDLDDRIIDEIGEDMEDMDYKSRQIEDYDLKRGRLYRGIIARGTYYAMEVYNTYWGVEKELPGSYEKGMVAGINWVERSQKVFERAEVRELDPKKVFLGSMFVFDIQEQDAVAIVEKLSYDYASSLYRTWERWKYVSKEYTPEQNGQEYPVSRWGDEWRLTTVENKKEVERIIIMKKYTNEMQVYLNGVQMLPVVQLMGKSFEGKLIVSGFPLTSISPSGDYPIAKGDFEPVDGFGISRGNPARMRVDQEVLDMWTKLAIEKTKASFKPTLVNNSGRVFSYNNFLAGNIVDDVKKDSVFPMFQSEGVTAGEFSFYQTIKQMMDDKSTSRGYEGQGQGDATATQILEDKKQQLMKLGLAMDGIINFERQLAYLRLRNSILPNWTKVQDVKIDTVRQAVTEVYKTVTVERAKYGKRQRSRKVINFTKNVSKIKELDKEGFGIHEMEEKQKQKTGIDIRYSYIDPEALRNLKARWHIVIVPSDKKDDTLSRLIFVQNVREAMEIFGPNSINVEKLKQRYSAVIGEDYDTWFIDEMKLQELNMAQQGMGGGSPGMKAPVNTANARVGMKTALQN